MEGVDEIVVGEVEDALGVDAVARVCLPRLPAGTGWLLSGKTGRAAGSGEEDVTKDAEGGAVDDDDDDDDEAAG